ncbi:MAK10-like protein [Tanacetum coccineum]
MGDANPIRTLEDYSKPSHEGYRNTNELPIGNNVDPNQHLKDFLKLVDSLDLDGSITTWEDLTTRFLAQFFPPGRTAKLRNDILMFQQHQGESLFEAWTRFKDLLQKVPHHGIDLWLQNDPMDFVKPVKAISLPQDVPSTPDRRLIELENQVQRLMEAHIAPMKPTQVNKITSSCEIYSGPHDTQYCMENLEQAFVEYASSRIDKAEDPQCSSHPSTLINAVKTCSKKTSHSQISQPQTRIGIETPQIEEPKPTLEDKFQDLHLNLLIRNSKPFDTLADLGSCVNIIPLYLFKKLNIRLLEETDHIFGLADGTKSYPVGIVKDVEVHIGKLKLLNNFYIIDMKKDTETPLLVGRGFLATANTVIDCRKAKIAIGKGITRSVYRVKGVDLGEEEAPCWTMHGKRESYKPRPSSDGVGARTLYYTRKDFLDCLLPGEWEIARDAKINPFKDVLVFRKFLGSLPINLNRNMWESEDLIDNPINWDKPPKNGDGAWHAKIRLIDLDEEEFTKTLQSIPTSRKLSERESPREIINLDHFYDT